MQHTGCYGVGSGRSAGQPEKSFYWEISSTPNVHVRSKFPAQRPRSRADQARVFRQSITPVDSGPRYYNDNRGGRMSVDFGHGGAGQMGRPYSSAGVSRNSSTMSSIHSEVPLAHLPPRKNFKVSGSRSHSVDPYTTRPGTSLNSTMRSQNGDPLSESWVRRRYWYQTYKTSADRPQIHEDLNKGNRAPEGGSHYGHWHHTEGGRPSADWMNSVSPREWPAGASRPTTGSKKNISLTDSGYLQDLHQRIMNTMDGSLTLTLTKQEKERRKSEGHKEDVANVMSLKTPEGGKREQLFEEVLRQLQGDGPMERLQARLSELDPQSTGRVSAEEFRKVLGMCGFQDRHIDFVLQQAGTEPPKERGGRVLVHYAVFIEILRLARNRKMALLQRARALQRKGLMRWQLRQIVRYINAWKDLAGPRHRRNVARAKAEQAAQKANWVKRLASVDEIGQVRVGSLE